MTGPTQSHYGMNWLPTNEPKRYSAITELPEFWKGWNAGYATGHDDGLKDHRDTILSQAIAVVEQFADDYPSALEALRTFRREGVIFG